MVDHYYAVTHQPGARYVPANFVGGARILLVGHYALAVANSVAHDPALTPGVSLTTASAAGGVVTVAAPAVAVRKLASFSLRGDAA